jgi:hypothetical protein
MEILILGSQKGLRIVECSLNRQPPCGIIRGAIHQLLSIFLKLRILVLLTVSTLSYVVKVKNYS